MFKVYRRQTKRFCAWMANTLHDEYKSSSFFVLSNQFIFLDYQASQLCVSCVKSTCCSQYRHLNTLYKLCTFAFQEYHFIINIALSHFYLLKDFFVVSSHFHFNFNTFELYFFLLSQTSLLKNSSKQQGFLFWLCMLVITCKKEIAVLPLSRHPHQTVGDMDIIQITTDRQCCPCGWGRYLEQSQMSPISLTHFKFILLVAEHTQLSMMVNI